MTGRPVAAIYAGTLDHLRTGPVEHAFSMPVQMAWVDLAALPGAFDGLPLWSARHPAPVWLRRADYGDGGRGPLGHFVSDLVAARLGRRPPGPIAMLTNPRTLGYVINPITVYFCGDPGAADEVLVLEVTNTPWRERHWYVLEGAHARAGARFAKQLHVSPFMEMDGEYRIGVDGPGTDLRIDLDLLRGGERVFGARLALRRRALTPRTAAGALLDRPFMTFAVWGGIHRHAFALWRKGVPYVAHPDPRAGAVR